MKSKECHNDLLSWLETDMEFACAVDISHFTTQLPVCVVGEGRTHPGITDSAVTVQDLL